jgi:ABC-type transporter Mla maintaining outer membrane lipid asymmetry ATPase subunit MlaF
MAANSQREVIIRVEDFTAAYNGQKVLEHVSFEVYAGEVFAILGGSAAARARCSSI